MAARTATDAPQQAGSLGHARRQLLSKKAGWPQHPRRAVAMIERIARAAGRQRRPQTAAAALLAPIQRRREEDLASAHPSTRHGRSEHLASRRGAPGTFVGRGVQPEAQRDGLRVGSSLVMTVKEEMPFLVDRSAGIQPREMP